MANAPVVKAPWKRPMILRRMLFTGLCLLSFAASASAPGVDISVGVINRITEYKLSKRQTRILDEATKLSAACRVFSGLYGRWPKDMQEIEARTTGIDFGAFGGIASLEEVPEGLDISFFDGEDERHVLATAMAIQPADVRASAQDPAFKIRISLKK
jgi:hypothetical protein